MKKMLAIALACMPIVSMGYSIDDLEKAVKESNLKEVQLVLGEVKLTEKDKISFLDLAQNTLNYRQEVVGGLEVKPDRFGDCRIASSTGDAFSSAAEVSRMLFIAHTIINAWGLWKYLNATDGQDVRLISELLKGGRWSMMISAAMWAVSTGAAAYCFESKHAELKKLYEDALAIKFLLYRVEAVASV